MKINNPNQPSSQPQPSRADGNQPSNTSRRSINNSTVEVEWVAIHLDNKFYLTTPSAYQKLMHLDQEISVEKGKFQRMNKQQANNRFDVVGDKAANVQVNVHQNQYRNAKAAMPRQNKVRKNSMESAMSRQCRTQINQLQALKAKIYAQKQLLEEQIRFQNQNKTMDIRNTNTNINGKRRILKDSTTFVVRNHRDRSIDGQQRSSQKHQQFIKISGKKFMIAPHQLSSRRSIEKEKDFDRSYEASISQTNHKINEDNNNKDKNKDSKYGQSQRYQTIQPKSIKNNDRSQHQHQHEQEYYENNTRKASTNSQQQNNRYFQSSKSKSKQKSFIITSRKPATNSSNNNNLSNYQNDTKIMKEYNQSNQSNSRVSQKQQIKQLTTKLKQMQQKLAQVEKKQQELEQIQKEKQKAYDALFQSRESSKMTGNSKISRSLKSRYNNINNNAKKQEVINENEIISNNNNNNNNQISNIPSPSDLKCSITSNQVNQEKVVQQNKQKQIEAQKTNKKQLRKQKQIQKQLQLQELQRKFQQKQKKLAISNTIITYNYNDDLQKQKKQTEQANSKIKMSEEIDQLKKVIKQLKIERIKQEAMLNDFQNGSSYHSNNNNNNNGQIRKNSNNFVDGSFSQMSVKDSQSKDSSFRNDLSFSFRQNVLQSEDKNNESMNVKIEDSFEKDKDRPLTKKQPRRILKIQTAQKTASNNNNNSLLRSNQLKQSQNTSKSRNLNKNNRNQQIISYNPEQSNKKYYQNQDEQRRESSIMKKRGIIMKQIINKQRFQSISVQSQTSNHKSQSKQLPFQSVSKASKQQQYLQKQPSSIHSPNSVLQSQPSKNQANLYPQTNPQQFAKPPLIIPDLPQQIQTFPIPDLPSTPLAQTSQSQILQLAVKICNIFDIKINGKESLQFKKYKNCVILKTVDNGNNVNSSTSNKAIVWHFSGKFYIGGWFDSHNRNSDSTEDQKNGEGFEFVPGKHYYRGEFNNGKRNGYGTMITLDGNIYQGAWVNGEKCGKGVSFEKASDTMYQGSWKDSKKQGKGILKTSNKQYYEGDFEKSIKSGQGTELFANGDVYIGSYKNGKFNGQGKYFWANGSVYIGNFVDGERQGFGKWRSSLIDGDQYEGQYKKDKKTGKGKYYWAKGCVFQGEFIADLKHGQGKVDYQDGRQVKGIWDYGKLKQIFKSEFENEQTFHSLDLEPRIRPNLPRMVQSPSKQMQESKLVHGV